MKSVIKKTLVAISLSVVLSGCSGDNGDEKTANVVIDDGYVKSSLKSTQGVIDGELQSSLFESLDGDTVEYDYCHTNGYCFDGDSAEVANSGLSNMTRRFKKASEVNNPEVELLPVFLQGMDVDSADGQRIVSALQNIEAVIGDKIFRQPVRVDIDIEEYQGNPIDAHSLYKKKGDADPAKITAYEDLMLRDDDPVKSGLFFSFGTLIPVMGTCEHSIGTVSLAPYNFYSIGGIVDNEGFLKNDGFVWLNLGVDQADCNTMDKVSPAIIEHEISHAIGLTKHFDSFGNKGVFESGAKAVLKTLYNNPAGTDFDAVTVYK
ncbi:hypothetical protein MD588_00430 [Photobacterium sp. SDRW27]|uniref:hypothetical protein n=1 Tax=Photobacterium obscurum TaxID=2829490 RepID=UPI002243A896|nr:hypothetical protein [Photobacterium obscurum]MCW8327266.1 hypothetical protein [Photobacterium obscurum]